MIRLLIVDDEVDICDFLKGFFGERDFQVFVAHNGKEALRVVEKESPQMVLLDIKMPVMDGMDTLKEIKKVDGSCRVIMMTKIDDPRMVEEAKKLGACEYLTKPLLLDNFEKTILGMAEEISGRPYA